MPKILTQEQIDTFWRDGATIGVGSTNSKSAPAGQVTVTRAKQTSSAGWLRPIK